MNQHREHTVDKHALQEFDKAMAADLRFPMDHYRNEPMLVADGNGGEVEPENVETEREFAVVTVLGMTYPATARELMRLIFERYMAGDGWTGHAGASETVQVER